MGYRVTRSAGSKGAWDLVGFCLTGSVLVQCKSNRWPTDTEQRELQDFPAPANARKLIVRMPDRKPIQARELQGGLWVHIE